MAHFLPRSADLRDRFDVASGLVPLGTGERLPTTFVEAKCSALRTMKRNSDVRSVTCICIRANDDLELVEFGPKGRATTLWNFTQG